MPSYQFNIFKEVESLNLWFKDTVFSVLCSCYPVAALVPQSPSLEIAVKTSSTGCCRPHNGPEPRGCPGAAARSAHPCPAPPSLLLGHSVHTHSHTHTHSFHGHAVFVSIPALSDTWNHITDSFVSCLSSSPWRQGILCFVPYYLCSTWAAPDT